VILFEQVGLSNVLALVVASLFTKLDSQILCMHLGGLVNWISSVFYCFFLFTVLLIMVAISGAAIALCLVIILIGCCYLKRYVAIFYDLYRDRVSQKLYPWGC